MKEIIEEIRSRNFISDFFNQTIKQHFVNIASVFSILLGLSVLVGWYIKSTAIIQVFPQFAPMQYNTALCFLLSGIGLFALDKEKYPITKICALIVGFIGIATLLQYIFSFDFGIDQLFMEHYIMTKTSHPGRMAPNTALCFTLTAFALFFHNNNTALFSLSSATLLLSIIALIGYFVGSENIYGWGTLTRMAVHTATGFFVLSIAFIVLCVKMDEKNFDLWKVSPSIVLITLITLTLIVTDGANDVLRKQNEQYFETLVNDSKQALEKRFELYVQALLGGLGAVNIQNELSRDGWRLYVESLNIAKTLPGTNGIGFIDSIQEGKLDSYLKAAKADNFPSFKNHPETSFKDKFIIRLIEPIEPNLAAVGLDIGFEKNRREGAEISRDKGIPILTKIIHLVQDNEKRAGFLLLVPTYKNKSTLYTVEDRRRNFKGWVYSPFMGRRFMEGIQGISKNQLEFKVYDGEILTDDNLIFSTKETTKAKYTSNFNYKTQVNFAQMQWTIIWDASESFAPPFNQNLPIIIFIIGLIFSLILSGIFYLLAKIYGTASRKLVESDNFQKLIKESNPDFLFVKDKDFRIVDANTAFINNYPKEERDKVIGYTTFEGYNKKEVEEFLKNDKIAFDKGISEVIEKIQFPNGQTRVLFTKKIRFENAKKEPFILGISRDVTEREEMVEELKRSNQELDDFAYIASHDLKEPLRGIHNYSSFLLEDYEDKLDEDGKNKLLTLTRLTQRMENLLNQLLHFSRIGREQEHFKKTNIDKIVRDFADTLKPVLEEKHIDVRIPKKLPTIKCAEVRIQEVFNNLITNATKYNDKDEKWIEIGCEKKKNKPDVFYVRDNGVGIKEKHIDSVFRIFKRLNSKEKFGDGTGSGLTIVKKIIEQHGGKIWIESTFSEGTTFYFTLTKGETNE